MVTLGIALTVAAVVVYAAFVLLGARIDGQRQRLRSKGLHPTTTDAGEVRAQETEAGTVSAGEQHQHGDTDHLARHPGAGPGEQGQR